MDIKIGNNQYQALKVDGTNRQIVYEANEIGELPKIFTPISTTTDFISLGDGDGRNSDRSWGTFNVSYTCIGVKAAKSGAS